MKPIGYFTGCQQAQNLEALDWTNGLTNDNKSSVARTAISALNYAIHCAVGVSRPLVFRKSDRFTSRIECNLLIADVIASTLDETPIEDCKALINYFNQF